MNFDQFDNVEGPGELTEEQKKAIELQQKMHKTVIISVTAGVLITLGLGILTMLLLLKFGVFTFNKGAFKDKPQTGTSQTDDAGRTSESIADSTLDSKLRAIESVMEGYYFGSVDKADAEDAICKAYVDAYGDEYSVYYNTEEYEKLSESIQGSSFYGVGASFRSEPGDGLLVMGFINNSAAEEAGLLIDDHVVEVDGTDVRDMDTDSAVTLIRGDEGSVVTFLVERDGEDEPFEIEITRRKVDEMYVLASVLDDTDEKIGYMHITEFTSKTGEQFRQELDTLMQDEEIDGLIIDLRNNTGGVVSAAVEILDMLLPEGRFGGMKFKDGSVQEFTGTTPERLDIPYTILVNQYTASASEIFAAAIQDYGESKLIGTKTFGKGITQKVVRLTDGSAVKYTDAELYSPEGNVWHKKGLTPDIEIEIEEDDDEDVQLNAAIEEVETALQ